MSRTQTRVLQWARRVRDFLVEHVLRSDLVELTAFRQLLDQLVEQLTANAAAQEAITKQALVQTTENKRLRASLREAHLKPIVRMSRTMKLEINGTDITFTLPEFDLDYERLAAAADAMVTGLKVLGPQFIARGFASNLVEQLSNTTQAFREAIDQRSSQVARRTGTTAAIQRDTNHVIQLVRLIDTLVRPVIENDPELLAVWKSVVALPRSPKAAGVVVAISAGETGRAAA